MLIPSIVHFKINNPVQHFYKDEFVNKTMPWWKRSVNFNK